MRDFAFSGIEGDSFDIDGVSCIERNWYDIRSEDSLDTTDKVSGFPLHGGRHRKGSSVLNRLKDVV